MFSLRTYAQFELEFPASIVIALNVTISVMCQLGLKISPFSCYSNYETDQKRNQNTIKFQI